MKPASVPPVLFSLLLLPLLGLATTACQQDPDRSGPEQPWLEMTGLPFSESHDSAGILIVENARPADTGLLDWQIGPEPVVSIGVVEGEGPLMLHRVGDATKLSDGRIVIAETGSSELKVFDSTGTYLDTWGGRGEGPGEFPSYMLQKLDRWQGDSLVAWYSPGWRVSVFDSEGNYARSFLGPGMNQASWQVGRPRLARTDGTLLTTLDSESADTALIDIRDAAGELYTSLGYHPARRPLYFSRELRVALWGDLVIVSRHDRYEFKAFAADGSLARIVRREHETRMPRAADILVDPGLRPEYRIPMEREMLRVPQSQIAETFPAFSWVMSDAAGYLWVKEYQPPREQRPVPLWTIFNPEGRVLGFVETPVGMNIWEIGEDYILGHVEDELGVEYVQVWPLKRWVG